MAIQTPSNGAIPPLENSVDGVSKPKEQNAAAPKPVVKPADKVATARTKSLLVMTFGLLYVVYVLACLLFIAILPSIDPKLAALPSIALAVSAAGAVLFFCIGAVLMLRIVKSDVSIHTRQWSVLRVLAIVVPGIVLGVLTPVMVMREPRLPLDIVDPVNAEDFVAPLPITFSAERAAETLRALHKKPLQYEWDTDGDGKSNVTTVVPTTTAIFERQAVYNVSVVIKLEGAEQRKISRRFTIQTAVFSIDPLPPIVEKPIRFSIAHLITDVKQLKEVQWDFSDEQGDEVTTASPDVVHTYYATGKYAVTATVLMVNNTQLVYKRTVGVEEAPPLPFPITLETEPKQLIGPAPFGAKFRIVTEEPIKEIVWTFGDGKEDRSSDKRSIARSFDQPKIYPVTVKVRSTAGKLAELSAIVRVTDRLQINDLTFDGEPVQQPGNGVLKGPVPLTVHLTPKTALPLIDFTWEDPEGDAVIQGTTISKVYRKQGNYTLTLIAQNPEGKVLRQDLKIQVDPPSPEPVLSIKPEGGNAPLTVVFDASETFIPPGQKVAGFEWLFGDETQQQNGELGAARVEHTYKTTGEFVATLRVVMADGKDYKVQRTIVVRPPNLSACISESRTTVQAGKGVEFDSTCSIGNVQRVQWDIRSQTNPDLSLAQSPEAKYVYVFDTPGVYNITLTVFDQFNNADKKTVKITVNP